MWVRGNAARAGGTGHHAQRQHALPLLPSARFLSQAWLRGLVGMRPTSQQAFQAFSRRGTVQCIGLQGIAANKKLLFFHSSLYYLEFLLTVTTVSTHMKMAVYLEFVYPTIIFILIVQTDP